MDFVSIAMRDGMHGIFRLSHARFTSVSCTRGGMGGVFYSFRTTLLAKCEVRVIVTASGIKGASPHAHFSASGVPRKGLSSRISPAIGKSTMRLQ